MGAYKEIQIIMDETGKSEKEATEFFIERKNPDFVNTNGKKVAVEVYCRKHKDLFRGGCDEWKEERQNIFKQYGWSILFIEDWQTNNEKKLLSILQKGG